ncbi:MAG: pyridoxine 5'-phosphate synthase [Gemmatimonadetes bacterium]|nr:pyridoxine 5'-phosphate synthase [Gemmatimonadota bacterium]
MTLLKVNVDHVATVREARRGAEPDPVEAALAAERAGASGITLHLRQDRRHVQERDLAALREAVSTEINLEMAVLPEMMRMAERYRPEQVTLVPERREEITTEGGLEVQGARGLEEFVSALHARRIVVSLFVDAEDTEIDASAAAGADAVEFHTGRYANASGAAVAAELDRLARGARRAAEAGLRVFAGHGLNYANVAAVASLPEVEELNIGHAIVSRALAVGFEAAVGEMLACLGGPPAR